MQFPLCINLCAFHRRSPLTTVSGPWTPTTQNSQVSSHISDSRFSGQGSHSHPNCSRPCSLCAANFSHAHTWNLEIWYFAVWEWLWPCVLHPQIRSKYLRLWDWTSSTIPLRATTLAYLPMARQVGCVSIEIQTFMSLWMAELHVVYMYMYVSLYWNRKLCVLLTTWTANVKYCCENNFN